MGRPHEISAMCAVRPPDDIADEALSIHSAGAEHVQLTNMTPLADPSRAAAGESLLRDAVAAIRRGAAQGVAA